MMNIKYQFSYAMELFKNIHLLYKDLNTEHKQHQGGAQTANGVKFHNSPDNIKTSLKQCPKLSLLLCLSLS